METCKLPILEKHNSTNNQLDDVISKCQNKKNNCIMSSDRIEAYWNGSILIIVDLMLQQCWACHSNTDINQVEEYLESLFGDKNFKEYYNGKDISEFNSYLASKIEILEKEVSKIIATESELQPIDKAITKLFLNFLVENRNNEPLQQKLNADAEEACLSFPRTFSGVSKDFGLSSADTILLYDSNFTRILRSSSSFLIIHFVQKLVVFKSTNNDEQSFSNEMSELAKKGFRIETKKITLFELAYELDRLQRCDFKYIKIAELKDKREALEKFNALAETLEPELKHLFKDCQSQL